MTLFLRRVSIGILIIIIFIVASARVSLSQNEILLLSLLSSSFIYLSIFLEGGLVFFRNSKSMITLITWDPFY